MEPGRTLLHYRLTEKLGEGGMGVVWRAHDTTLGRDVAIKVLPEALARDAERLARFEREAKLLATLNHPHIASVYGLHAHEGTRFIAMELVEGETLAARLARGRLPVDEAMAVGRQVAEALQVAHERGVVHRDLKPANIQLTPGGKAKVLDFGLAKAMDSAAVSSAGSLSLSPTVTSLGTVGGVILGTAAYMSPEQGRGKPVDRRTDLWSFGCVLYESLTGMQLFRGETVSDSLAAILRKDPDWSALPADTPPLVRVLLRRCLCRDPERRIQDAGDVRLELEQAIEDPRGESLGLGAAGEAIPAARGAVRWLPWAVTVAALLVAALLALRGEGMVTGARETRRLTIPVPGPTEFGDLAASPPAISPDGRQLVFGVTDAGGETQLWLRPLDDFTARPLPGTTGAAYAFWSHDSRHIAFFVGGKLRRMEVGTGRIQIIGKESSSYPRGGSWGPNGKILFVPNSNTGVHLIDAAGGESRQITTPDPDIPDSSHRWPWFLPDGEHYLFVLWTNDLRAQEEHGGVYVASLSGREPPRRVVADASSVAYVPSGHLLLLRGDNLIAIPFDASTRQVTGEATVIASGVLRNRANGHGAFTASSEGTLVYAGGQAFVPSTLTWFDRSGDPSPAGMEAAPFSEIRLAPGGDRAAVVIPGESGDGEIWIVDLVRGVRTRLVHALADVDRPVWSGDGTRILYGSQERGSLDFYLRSADGSGEPQEVFVDGVDKVLYDWSRDGKYAAYWPMASGSGTPDLWLYTLEGGQAASIISGESTYTNARFSPDRRWIAYSSDDSGRMEVFVQALEDQGSVKAGARWRVSTAGGERPHWRNDGREIVYRDPGRRVMAVAVEAAQGTLSLGTPRELFAVGATIVAGDATGDHQRFLFAIREEVESEPLHVILNWPAALAER